MALGAHLVRFLLRRLGAVVAVLAVAQSALLLALRPGVLSIDEVTYLAMARSAAHGNLLGIDNGSALGLSPELEWGLAREVGGRLVAQYPAGYALLAAPFYLLLGGAALFVLNTVAFYATVLLTRRIARRVLASERAALLAAAIFAGATFAWEYGAAQWPHAITMLFTCAAVDATLAAVGPRRRVLAGLLVGLATTIRLDAIFVVPALLLVPLVLERQRASWRDAMALLVGLAPGLLLLAITNHVKFGTWMPLSYGPWQGEGSNTGASSYVLLGLVAVLGLVAAHVIVRRPERFDRRHLAVVVVAAALFAVVVPSARAGVLRLIDGLWTLVIDLRHRELDALESALTRSPRGAMIYVGTLKTSLVQSLPYLPLLVLSLAHPRARARKIALALPIAAYVAVFSAFRWHGGLSVNLRYFVPILPLVAVLAADGLAQLARLASGSLRVLRVADLTLLACLAVIIEASVLLHLPTAALATREIFYLDVPLVLAALLAGASAAAWRLKRGRVRRWVASAAFVLAVGALAWAGMTAFGYDAVAVAKVRGRGRELAAEARKYVAPGSLVVVEYADPAALLLEDGTVIATGPNDDFADTARLVERATCGGHRAYAVLNERKLAVLRDRTADAIVVDVLDADLAAGFGLAELRPRTPSCGR